MTTGESLPVVLRLRARLDEYEAVARVATAGPWVAEHAFGTWFVSPVAATTTAAGNVSRLKPGQRADAHHIAANDPATVLRTIQAHRKILDAHPLTVYTDEEPGYAQVLNDHLCPGTQTPCLTLRALVSIYREAHPGFDPAWIGEG